MTSRKSIIGGWLLYLIIALALYFMEMFFIPINSSVRFMAVNEFVPFFFIIIILSILLLFLERKYIKNRLSYIVGGTLLALFLMYMVVILLFPSNKEFVISTIQSDGISQPVTYLFLINNEEKLYFILMAFISLLMIYFYIVILPKKYYFSRVFNVIYWILICLMVSAITYSYLTEFDLYIDAINGLFSKGVHGYNVPQSFFINRNNFGFFYFTMICFTLLVHHNRPKWYMYLVASFLFINSIPVVSKTNISLSFFILNFYLITRFFLTYKDSKKRNLITLLCLGGFYIIIAAITISSYFVRNDIFEAIKKIVKTTLNIEESKGERILGRTSGWKNAIEVINQTNWVFGAGFGVFNDLFRVVHHGSRIPHSGYLQMIAEGGIITLLCYLAFMGYLIYLIKKIYPNHKSLALLEIGFMIAFHIHMCFETEIPLYYSVPMVDGLLFTFLLVVPILNAKYKDDNQEELKQIVEESKYERRIIFKKNNYSFSYLALFLLTPILGIFIGGTYTLYQGNINLTCLIYIIPLLLIYFLCPYFIARNEVNKNDKGKINIKDYLYMTYEFYIALAIFIIFFIGMSFIMKDNRSSLLFVSILSIVIYISIFVMVRPLSKEADSLITFFNNFNMHVKKVYGPFIHKEMEYRKRKSSKRGLI